MALPVVKVTAPTLPTQGALPLLESENAQVWANNRVKSLITSVLSLVACAVSNSKAAPKTPQDGQLLLSRWPWWPVAGQVADGWVFYDGAANLWRALTTAPTTTH